MVKGAKRWKKGQSSSSNPEIKKYREAAKSTFFNFGGVNKKSTLTSDALAKLDSSSAVQKNIKMDDDDDNQTVVTNDTFQSWASNWSDCTNATFNRVHKYWKSNSALHKEILAVLAAITEVIKAKEGKENEVEYFAALMTGLESVMEVENSVTAFLYLIALAIRKVPAAILRVKYQELIKTFVNILETHVDSENTTLMKSTLMCLCWILKEQDKQVWQEELAQSTLFMILSFVNHPKPKVRKAGQEAMKLILKCCSASIISTTTADYCLKMIENSGNLQNNTQILYTMTFMKQIIHEFHSSSLKAICECLFRLLTLNNIMITSACFQMFHQLFISETTHLNANINGQLINAFYDYRPSENDPQQVIAWLAVMESAFKNLNRLNSQICSVHLPHIFNVCMSIMSSYHENILLMSTNVMKSLLETCVKPNIELYITDLKQTVDIEKSLLKKIFTSIQDGLNYQFHSGWLYVMQILTSTFTAFADQASFPIVKECLTSLASLRESEQFSFKNEADFAISRAIRTYGPQLVLTAIDINITGDEQTYEFSRSWMLPLFRDNIEKTELDFFIKYFMPLAIKLRTRSLEFYNDNKQFEFKIFDTLQNQIWSLFPGFCTRPTDLDVSFKSIAKMLADLIDKAPDLRIHVLNGMKCLVNKNQDENKATMSKYAKNYLPILFNIYMMDKRLEKDPLRQLLLETIKCYLKIADNQLCNEFLQRAYARYCESCASKAQTSTSTESATAATSDDTDFFTKYSLLDLLAILVSYANEANIKVIYELALSGINDTLDKTVQKKSYKIMNTILNSGKVATAADGVINTFIKSNLTQIANTFVTTLAKCNAAAKPPRLRCISDLLDYISDRDFIRKILPEVILCIKEVNHKSRDASFLLINTMAKLWIKLTTTQDSTKSEPDALYEYVHLLMIGFAGSKPMIICSCMAMAALADEFREHITGSLIRELIESACLLLTKSNDKEIVISSLQFIRTLCIIFNDATLAQFLNDLLSALINLKDTMNKKFTSQRIRNEMKVILKKLIKKFSYEIILEKLMQLIDPARTTIRQDFQKQMQHLKKILEREKKIKEGREERAHDAAKSKKDLDLISVYTKATSVPKAQNNDIEYLLEDSDSEDEKAEEAVDMKSQKTNKTSKTAKSSSRALKKEKGQHQHGKANTWIKEDAANGDEPLDLLDPMAIRNVLATKPLTQGQIQKKKEKEMYNKNKNRGFKVNDDGRLIINDDDDDKDGDDDEGDSDDEIIDNKSRNAKKKEKIRKSASANLSEIMDTLSLSKVSTKSAGTKKKDDKEDSDEEEVEDDAFSYKTGGAGIHRNLGKDQQQQPKRKKITFGQEYRAKKARGDMKRPGKPDPYAYVPLNMNKLNKRKSAKLKGEFKGLVKAARTGARKGMAARKYKK